MAIQGDTRNSLESQQRLCKDSCLCMNVAYYLVFPVSFGDSIIHPPGARICMPTYDLNISRILIPEPQTLREGIQRTGRWLFRDCGRGRYASEREVEGSPVQNFRALH